MIRAARGVRDGEDGGLRAPADERERGPGLRGQGLDDSEELLLPWSDGSERLHLAVHRAE